MFVLYLWAFKRTKVKSKNGYTIYLSFTVAFSMDLVNQKVAPACHKLNKMEAAAKVLECVSVEN